MPYEAAKCCFRTGRSQAEVLLNREEAWKLLCEWTESDSLRKHMLAVAAAMRAYSGKFGADEESGAA